MRRSHEVCAREALSPTFSVTVCIGRHVEVQLGVGGLVGLIDAWANFNRSGKPGFRVHDQTTTSRYYRLIKEFPMKVILLGELRGKGEGDVEVAQGYAENFLFPNKDCHSLLHRVTSSGEERRHNIAKREEQRIADLEMLGGS